MSSKQTHQTNWMHTLLVVAGVAIALLISLLTFIYSPPSTTPLVPTSNEQPTSSESDKGISEDKSSRGGGMTLNSSARLFQFFTENLPYLNNK